MLEKLIYEANKIFSNGDFTTVVSYVNENKHPCISGITNDDKLYGYIVDLEEEDEYNHFSFREWKPVKTIVETVFSRVDNGLNITIDKDSNDNPCKMIFKNNTMKYNHYLQSFTFTDRQPDMLTEFKKKKIELKKFNGMGNPEIFSGDALSNIRKLGTLLTQGTCHYRSDESGTYLCFGDENNSSDNASILVSEENILSNDKSYEFDNAYLTSISRTFIHGEDYKIKLMKDKIIFVKETDKFLEIIILRGKA